LYVRQSCGGSISSDLLGADASDPDGAKIYLCNWRCSLLTWQGRCSILHRLSPRESWLQNHHPKMRSVPERGSGNDEPLQHGEVFVTDDGAETDLDLGHYE